jgi:hypothetical protein
VNIFQFCASLVFDFFSKQSTLAVRSSSIVKLWFQLVHFLSIHRKSLPLLYLSGSFFPPTLYGGWHYLRHKQVICSWDSDSATSQSLLKLRFQSALMMSQVCLNSTLVGDSELTLWLNLVLCSPPVLLHCLNWVTIT